jgi:hypothetical protein
MTYWKTDSGEVYDLAHTPHGAEWTKLTNASGKRERAGYCTAELRKLIPQGSVVYTVLRSVARSGMSRTISVVVMSDGVPRDVTYLVADACGYRRNNRDHLVIGGCGMDMGFAVAYDLASKLYRDTHVCTGETCRSNDHSNGDRDYTPHKHADGGYSLNHSWL